MTKRLITLSLLLMLLYNLIGYFAAFRFVKKEWRGYVEQKLYSLVGKNKSVSFKFATAEFDISEHEFIHKGRFYDVLKYEIVGDSVIVDCFDDSTETQLVQQFHTILFKNTAQKSNFDGKTQFLFSCLVKEYIFDTPFSLQYPPSVYALILTDFYYKNPFISPPFLQLDSPPPQGILI